MFKQLIDTTSYEGYALVATVFFFFFFLGMLLRVLTLKKSYITEMERLPLDSSDITISDREE